MTGNVVVTDGFDLYASTTGGNPALLANTGVLSVWTTTGTLSGTALITGRLGGQALRVASSSPTTIAAGLVRAFPSNYSAFAIGCAVRFPAVMPPGTASLVLFAFGGGGGIQFSITVNSSGAVVVFRGSTQIGISTGGVISVNTWQHVGVEASISATIGTINVYIDGVSVLTLTSINNKNVSGSAGVDNITLAQPATTADFDDLYVIDTNTWLGERRIETIRPTSDSSVVFTPNSGANNYSRVNETTVDGDTSYVSGTNVGDKDLYAFGSLSNTPTTIDAINVIIFAEKTDATTRTLDNSVTSNGTASDGSATALAIGYSKLQRIIQTDPSGGAAFIPARVNAILAGPKVAA